MLVIRLFRVGKKNQPSFKIIVTDKRRPPKSGRFVEEVGFYNPLTKEKVLKSERIKYWLSVGAKPSVTVNNLLISARIVTGKKIPKHKKPKEKAELKEKVEEIEVPKKEKVGKEETVPEKTSEEKKEKTKKESSPEEKKDLDKKT